MLLNHLKLSSHAFPTFRRKENLYVFAEEWMILVSLEYAESLFRLYLREDGVYVWKKALDCAQIVLGKLPVVLNPLRHKMRVPDKERFLLMCKRYCASPLVCHIVCVAYIDYLQKRYLRKGFRAWLKGDDPSHD